MPPPNPTPGTPEDWLARGKAKLALARVALPAGGRWEDLCFWAQQAAELRHRTAGIPEAGVLNWVAWFGLIFPRAWSSSSSYPDVLVAYSRLPDGPRTHLT